MADFNTEKVLEWLDQYIGREANCYFNNPADPETIASFEKMARIRLPESYKAFLKYTNGGMIVNNSINSIIKRDNDILTAKWNSNCLLSIEELKTEWNNKKNTNFGISQKDWAIYPIIPFFKTNTNEYLVFISTFDKSIESPVFDAFHEEPPENWGLVANDFNEFLYNYLKTNGFPDVMGDEALGVASDFIGPAYKTPTKEETHQHIIERTTKYLKYKPDDDYALLERGIAYSALGKLKSALKDFNKSIALVDDDAYYYFNRGDLLMRAGKNRAALIDFDIAVKLEPEDCLYRNCRATVLQLMQKYDKAIADLNKVLQIDGRNLLAYYLRESIYRTLGETEKADSDLQKIEELKKEE